MRASLVLAVACVPACGGGDGALFNGRDLEGWYTWLPSKGRDNDPLGVFAVRDGMIHILGVDVPPAELEFGYLSTIDEYEDVRIRFEYKWGPRLFVNFPRDSGFFITVVGEDKIWPRSHEVQVMENDTGSLYMFEHATLETTVDDAAAPAPRYQEGGQPYTTARVASPYPRVTHSAAYDSLTDWNTVEIVLDGEAAEHVVNGHTTFRSTRRRQPHPDFPDDPAMDIPLTRGRLVIQQEGAEVFYRNITVEPL